MEEEKKIKIIQKILAGLALICIIPRTTMIILKNWNLATINYMAMGAFLWILVVCQERKITELKKIENELKSKMQYENSVLANRIEELEADQTITLKHKGKV